jgi:DNA-binding PadR family transcriptional regulator
MSARIRSEDIESHLPLRPVEFFVLAVLKDGPRHGYGIVQEVGRRTADRIRIRPGNLYRVLDRMLERGLLEVAERRVVRGLDEERRTYYRITPLGRRVVAAEAEMLGEFVADVTGKAFRQV